MRNHFAALVLILASSGCATITTHHSVALSPSFVPVDASRPRVEFLTPQIGENCGEDAVAGAIADLKRHANIDGYVEVLVTVTDTVETHCAKVTAFPFRYGTDTSSPTPQVGPVDTATYRIVPGRDDAPVSKPDPWDAECTAIAGFLHPAGIAHDLEKDRCIQRALKPDVTFQTCITAANSPESAQLCVASN